MLSRQTEEDTFEAHDNPGERSLMNNGNGDVKTTFWNEAVRYIPPAEAVMVARGTPILEAASRMDEHGVGYVLVMEADGRLAGIATTSDIMHDYVETTMTEETTIEAVMQTELVTLKPDATISEAAETFHANGVQHLPVVNPDGTVSGLLSVREMMTFIAEHQPREVLNRPPDSSLAFRKKEGV